MASEKIRLGGMALQNGVLVHGPTAWAAAVRTASGELKVAAAKKRVLASRLDRPLLRGPARLVEAIAILPDVRRRLPEAALPFHRPAGLAAVALGALAAATELYAWTTRSPDRRLAKALARPGHELQHRLATADPSPAQLEVAEAALQACLALEG